MTCYIDKQKALDAVHKGLRRYNLENNPFMTPYDYILDEIGAIECADVEQRSFNGESI